ncbi:hypothetical protein RND81_01G185100 [Saponaria officinalis]|uniref:Cationic amino acid transporter 9 n=1 Tax=Saponaria officinalis TaxID=3572 RepID=A0AAW1NGN7_SAPOF
MNSSERKSSIGSSSPPTWVSNFWASARRSKPLEPGSTGGVENSGDGLIRRLGLFELVLIGIGASIGAGIFVVTGTVARDAGPAVTLCFILAGISCILNALCYAELASRCPAVVGGAYMYTYSAFNELTAFLVFAQLMLDYHIGAASIARSLAGYVVALLELSPSIKGNIPNWIGHGGQNFLGVFSINVLAPILLCILTAVLCWGVGESSVVNSFMTVTKVAIVLVVIIAGSFKVDVSNWSPFVPNGFDTVLTGATVVFFAYVGFDAVANSAEESKRPQRDLPLGIIGSLLICIGLYIGVCLVITGMVPYNLLGEEAPLAAAFTSKGLKFVSVLISVGAVAGLTTTLLVGLYVQSRLYLGLGRDGLLPQIFAKVNLKRHTPMISQIWVGLIAGVMAGLLNTGYSVVAACVLSLRFKEQSASQNSGRWLSKWAEGVIWLVVLACCGFTAGALYRFNASYFFLIIPVVVALVALGALYLRQAYSGTISQGFSCPGVPFLPAICIFFNIFLFAQLHFEAWVRFVVVSIISLGLYAFYGQYHAKHSSEVPIIYHRASPESPLTR